MMRRENEFEHAHFFGNLMFVFRSVDLERIEMNLDELSSDGIHVKHYNVVRSLLLLLLSFSHLTLHSLPA